MESFIGFFQQGLSFVVPLVILLGILIFVHELGHFLVAKYYGVKVEVFSLGFGKKLFSFQRGDTQYCVSLIPLGGYVKMYGDDPTAEVPDEEKSGSFLHKPVGQRIAIVLAGPIMNLLLAGVLFFGIALIGEKALQPVVGDVDKNTPAFEAGFRYGDRILSVNSQEITTWKEAYALIEESITGAANFQIQRRNSDRKEELNVTPKLVPNQNIISSADVVGTIGGLSYAFRSSRVGVPYPDSPAAKAGVEIGDVILSINGQKVLGLTEAIEVFGNLSTQEQFELELLRPSEKADLEKQYKTVVKTTPLSKSASGWKVFAALGFERADLYLPKVREKTAAEKAGLKAKDKIVSINGEPIKEWTDLTSRVQAYDEKSNTFIVGILRDGKNMKFNIQPRIVEEKNPVGEVKKRYDLGVTTVLYAEPLTFVQRTSNPITAAVVGFEKTLKWTRITCVSFLRILQNRVSAKAIGGPIMIGQLASKTFQIGISPFLKIMAIISINLFILNLLPVPVLDGGHLLFFTIEAIRGAPISMKKMEIAQQVGLILLLGLMVFAIFNDVSRIIG